MLKQAPLLGAAVLGAALLATLVWWIHGFMSSKVGKPARTVQMITLIKPPPPPPPPDTPPPPPPPKVDEQIPQNVPDPTPDNTPAPAPDLGIDATGTAGGDAFGLAARHGGADLVGSGGAIFKWYTSKLQDAVTDRLSSDPKLRGKKYTAGVRIWIAADGHIKDVQLVGGTGNHDLDGTIAADLGALGRLSEAPPLEMPQPVSLQIVSRS
jgi:protein TonB